MSSGKFILGGVDSPKKDACLRFLLVLILLGVVSVAVLMGCYAFNSVRELVEGCNKQPELDPYGLSNWTHGAQSVAFGCFPGHEMEGHETVVMSQCVDNAWVPPPPACTVLPILLTCDVNQHGVEGRIQMWQTAKGTPTVIHGFLNVEKVEKGHAALLEAIELSRSVCAVDTEFNASMPEDAAALGENTVEVHFRSCKVLAYKKATLRLAMIFIDESKHLRSTVVSLHQGQETVVMDAPLKETVPIQEVQGQETVAEVNHNKIAEFADGEPSPIVEKVEKVLDEVAGTSREYDADSKEIREEVESLGVSN